MTIDVSGRVAEQTTAKIREAIVTDTNIIKSDGSCPFSVSDNLKIEAASYDLNLEYIFKLLLSEIQAGNQNGKLFIENIVSILALHFVKNYSKEQSSGLVENVSGFTNMEIEKVVYYIDKNMSENIKIENLAEEFGISKFNFNKRFKSSTNVTLHQFIIKKKLDRSKNLLKENSLSLSDITYMLNFSDQSHFSNSFKKMYGMTPREFRKTIE